MLQTKTANTVKEVELIYKLDGAFAPDPNPVFLEKGDVLTFKCPTELLNATVNITLDGAFFEPATFKNGDPPVKPIQNGTSEYKCEVSGTYEGRAVDWASEPGAGGFTSTSGL
jgi:hypothetical protein